MSVCRPYESILIESYSSRIINERMLMQSERMAKCRSAWMMRRTRPTMPSTFSSKMISALSSSEKMQCSAEIRRLRLWL